LQQHHYDISANYADNVGWLFLLPAHLSRFAGMKKLHIDPTVESRHKVYTSSKMGKIRAKKGTFAASRWWYALPLFK